MPKHVINRTDEIPTENWEKILKLASKLDFSKAHLVPPFQLWFSAVIALDWLFGKRINEILTLRQNSISFTSTQIRVKFFVGKKRSRKTPLELQPYLKARNINHKAVPYIKAYLEEYNAKYQAYLDANPTLKLPSLKNNDTYLFPCSQKSRILNVRTKFINGKGEEETRPYTYTIPGGYIHEDNAQKWLNKINAQLPENERLYFHYGRHNVGIKMAYQSKSAIEIGKVLDETPRAALSYTEHASALGSDWTKETE